MILQNLSILNYKNIREAEVNLSPKINCFVGNNGMGKTNFLDAVYYLSFCKSHSNPQDSQNIMHEEEFFLLQGEYLRLDTIENIYCGMKRRQKKQFKRNKKEYEKLSDHIGLLPLVLVSPDDISLIYEGSEERRKFMDGVISQYNKEYLVHLLHYGNALKQRNALLKSDFPDASLMDIWEEQMEIHGSCIFRQRIEFIERFTPIFQNFYQKISRGNETISLIYTSQYQKHNDLIQRMKETRERDLVLGYSTQGIHKDELEMNLGENPIKRVGSQGQNKTFLISLKFAQFEFLRSIHGFPPILLLDDIFDKLDAERVEEIIKLVSSDLFGQIFITDTNREHLDLLLNRLSQNASIFYIKDGNIIP